MTPDQKQIIVHIVLKHFKNVNSDELMSRAKPDRIAFPRQVAMRAMLKMGMSSPAIGTFFNRDHSTVLHASKVVGNRIETEPGTKARVELIMHEILG